MEGTRKAENVPKNAVRNPVQQMMVFNEVVHKEVDF